MDLLELHEEVDIKYYLALKIIIIKFMIDLK